jgi:Leucine-rich repeat (LRR) protein
MNSDIIFCIFEYLNSIDLLNCSLTNKQFYAISTSELLWKRLCDQEYETQVTNNYRTNYKSWSILYRFLVKYNAMGTNIKDNIINLCGRQLKSIPDEFVLLKNVSFIEFSSNNLNVIPSQIFLLVSLKGISLDYNHIEVIPENISVLTNLQTLYIAHNELRWISESICMLTKLLQISIEYNNLQSIPSSISLLTNLCDLYIDYTQEKLIPESLVGKLQIMPDFDAEPIIDYAL